MQAGSTCVKDVQEYLRAKFAAAPAGVAKGLTVFDAAGVPELCLGGYFARLAASFQCSAACSVLAAVYLERSGVTFTKRNAHRLTLASLLLAAKYHDDAIHSDRYYSKCGGVHVDEIPRVVFGLLAALDWKLFVTPALYADWEQRLQSRDSLLAPLSSLLTTRDVSMPSSVSVYSSVDSSCGYRSSVTASSMGDTRRSVPAAVGARRRPFSSSVLVTFSPHAASGFDAEEVSTDGEYDQEKDGSESPARQPEFSAGGGASKKAQQAAAAAGGFFTAGSRALAGYKFPENASSASSPSPPSSPSSSACSPLTSLDHHDDTVSTPPLPCLQPSRFGGISVTAGASPRKLSFTEKLVVRAKRLCTF
ncbi:Cyclin-U4-1 [Diplonema papillatum]|nr:Cyclin-U4-1 [Diplonema papillatum]|eukprot:gene10234-15737_t